MEIIAHCGWMKTGSSTIQTELAVNRKLLLDKYGIFYPESAVDVSHNELCLYRNRLETCQEIFDKYCLDAQRAGAQTLLVSSEALYTSLPLLKISHPVTVLQYIRYFPSYHESRVKQEVNNKLSSEIFSMYLKNRRVESLIDRTSAGEHGEEHLFRVFGKVNPDFNLGLYSYACRLAEKFDCKFFSFEAHKGNLLHHFLSQIGIIDECEFEIVPTQNITPSMSALHFIAAINMLPMSDAIRLEFAEVVSKSVPRIDGEDKWLLVKPEEYQEWMEKMRYALDGFARLIGDPAWTEKNFQWLENKTHIPWHNIPNESATAIFHALPEHLQSILKNFYLYDEENDICFLPPLLSSEIQNQLLHGWRKSCLQVESALAEVHKENLKNVSLLEEKQNFLQEIESINASLQQRIDAIISDNEQLKLTAQALEAQNNKLVSELSAMQTSLSWRSTAPLRSLMALFR